MSAEAFLSLAMILGVVLLIAIFLVFLRTNSKVIMKISSFLRRRNLHPAWGIPAVLLITPFFFILFVMTYWTTGSYLLVNLFMILDPIPPDEDVPGILALPLAPIIPFIKYPQAVIVLLLVSLGHGLFVLLRSSGNTRPAPERSGKRQPRQP